MQEHTVVVSEVTTLRSRVSQTVVKSVSHDSDEWKMLLIENERLIAKINIIEQELAELRKVRVQRDQLVEDMDEVRQARQRAENMLGSRDSEIQSLKNIVDELSQEIKIKMRIIDEKTFMLVDLEKELDRERNDTTEIQKFYKQLDQNKAVMKRLEEENDMLRLDASKLKEEFLFKNQVEESVNTMRKALEDERDLSMTKDTRIKDLEDRIGIASGPLNGLPILEQNN